MAEWLARSLTGDSDATSSSTRVQYGDQEGQPSINSPRCQCWKTKKQTKTIGVVCVEIGKFRFYFLLHLKVHQVRRGTGGAGLGLGVNTPPGA